MKCITVFPKDISLVTHTSQQRNYYYFKYVNLVTSFWVFFVFLFFSRTAFCCGIFNILETSLYSSLQAFSIHTNNLIKKWKSCPNIVISVGCPSRSKGEMVFSNIKTLIKYRIIILESTVLSYIDSKGQKIAGTKVIERKKYQQYIHQKILSCAYQEYLYWELNCRGWAYCFQI